MKRLTTIITIVCIILILSFLGICQISNVSKTLGEKLDTVNEYIDTDKDNKLITNICENMIDEWDKRGNYISMYVTHENIDNIEEDLIALNSYCKLYQYDKAKITIDQLKFHLDHVYQSELPLLKNIF